MWRYYYVAEPSTGEDRGSRFSGGRRRRRRRHRRRQAQLRGTVPRRRLWTRGWAPGRPGRRRRRRRRPTGRRGRSGPWTRWWRRPLLRLVIATSDVRGGGGEV
ncbi:hypothetical protein D1007_37979 [Hordeum vulgare]|nr:hypothetical protein D1007_37979 [Hordeum vulgare]